MCPTSMKQICDKPKHSWRAQVSQRTHHFWHPKQWHMFNHTGNCSVRRSQDALFGLFCDTSWPVWYPKVHYYNVKPQVDISFMLQAQNMLFSHLPSGQAKKKHSKQEFQTNNSLDFTAFKVSSSFLYTCLQEAEASCYMRFSISPG